MINKNLSVQWNAVLECNCSLIRLREKYKTSRKKKSYKMTIRLILYATYLCFLYDLKGIQKHILNLTTDVIYLMTSRELF